MLVLTVEIDTFFIVVDEASDMRLVELPSLKVFAGNTTRAVGYRSGPFGSRCLRSGRSLRVLGFSHARTLLVY